MKEQKTSFWHKDSTRSVIASLLSILIGLLVGAVLILIVGVSNKSLGLKSAWEGIRLVLFGLFSTGRDASGALTFGFNPTSIGNMLFHFCYRFFIDQRPDGDAFLQPVADVQFAHRLLQFFGKAVIHAVLHV